MKQLIISLAITATLIAGTIFSGCESSNSKAEKAQIKMEMDKQNMMIEQQNATTEAQENKNGEEWKAFRSDAVEKIKNNEIRISEAREKMKEAGKVMDAVYEKKIDLLEERNKNLQARIDAYDKNQTGWESFKREFNHDMDELGQAFKDLVVDNKK